MRNSSLVRVSATVAVALTLAGCAGNPVPASSTTGSPLPTSTATTDPSSTKSPPPRDARAEFRHVADASCDRANAEGVVEETADGTARNILFPKKSGFRDYNAAFHTDDDGDGLIWTTEEFLSCNASVGFSMAEDSELDYDITIKVLADGGFDTTYVNGLGDKIFTRYFVTGGNFSAAVLGRGENPLTMTITYGPPSDADFDVLVRAVENFLAED